MKVSRIWLRLSFVLFAVSAMIFLTAPKCPDGDLCLDNSDCASLDYCNKAVGNCEGWGQCAVRPLVCNEIYAPVCGCDRQTFENSCYAAANGASVLANEPCDEVLCPDRACGPQLGMPNYLCPNGTLGGPTGRCLRHDDGACGWEVRDCPGQ